MSTVPKTRSGVKAHLAVSGILTEDEFDDLFPQVTSECQRKVMIINTETITVQLHLRVTRMPEYYLRCVCRSARRDRDGLRRKQDWSLAPPDTGQIYSLMNHPRAAG